MYQNEAYSYTRIQVAHGRQMVYCGLILNILPRL